MTLIQMPWIGRRSENIAHKTLWTDVMLIQKGQYYSRNKLEWNMFLCIAVNSIIYSNGYLKSLF